MSKYKLPKDSAAKVIEDAVESGEIDTDKPVEIKTLPAVDPDPKVETLPAIDPKPITIKLNANDANFMANELREVKGEVELDTVVKKAMDRKDEVTKERSKRKQHDHRLIVSLRSADPPGKKTCGRCAYRVDIAKMCPKQELCDICYE